MSHVASEKKEAPAMFSGLAAEIWPVLRSSYNPVRIIDALRRVEALEAERDHLVSIVERVADAVDDPFYESQGADVRCFFCHEYQMDSHSPQHKPGCIWLEMEAQPKNLWQSEPQPVYDA